VQRFDIIIIGGGIAGVSAACFLAEQRGDGSRIAVLEQESQPGYHTTGRSAAIYTEIYGNDVIRAMVRAARPFLQNPDARYSDHPFLSPRGSLMIAGPEQIDRVDPFLNSVGNPPGLEILTGDQAVAKVPVLRPDRVATAVYEDAATDIDVHGLNQGYIRVFKGLGGHIVTDAEVHGIERQDGDFIVATRTDSFRAPQVVNAAGAWGDVIAGMVGAEPVGLVPKRRTALTFDPPPGTDHRLWPLCFDIDEQWYFKPDAGRLMGSPADQTPSQPCDAQPEELDLAICIDRIETATTMQIRRPASTWAGLRTFVGDHSPVNGFDDRIEGFYWLVGQGGYGIKTSPAMGRIATALLDGEAFPQDIIDQGLDPARLAVDRLRQGEKA